VRDHSDREPSLGSLNNDPSINGHQNAGDQTNWARSSRCDREFDESENGIADSDGLNIVMQDYGRRQRAKGTV